ncbi:MAG: hypothetical protein HYS12_22745 [Planctomycetes bacterium]|nr:hypothetical protein [Planctomycetota bacterium]
MDQSRPVLLDRRALCAAAAFVWLASAFGVLHPSYRESAAPYMEKLALPNALMVATCVAEALIGLRVLFGPANTWVTVLQVGLISIFTLILAAADPKLLVNPFGVLSKNVSMVAVIVTAWLLEREGWTARADRMLRAGLAFIWVWEGTFANAVFQSDTLRGVIAATKVPLDDPSLFLTLGGIGEALSGAALLVLRGRPLRWLLTLHAVGLLGICGLVTNYDPRLWFHFAGPLTKNVPLLVGTLVLLRHHSALIIEGHQE